MLVLSSASPWFHWISACPGEQTLDSRNKWQKSKLLLVSWLVLSCLLVSQWHLTVRPWIKHLVRMLDGSTFGVFSKQFFWNKTYIIVLELWGAATSVPPWRGVWGWLCGCRHCSRIQAYPWHCSLQVLLTHSSFCADECCDPGRAVFWVIPVFVTSRACKYCFDLLGTVFLWDLVRILQGGLLRGLGISCHVTHQDLLVELFYQ